MATKSLFKNTIIVGTITLLSRFTGLARDFFVAKYLGAGRLSDCFLVAFKLPNLFRSIFAEGAFNSSFIPIFSGVLHTKGKDKAKIFCKELFALLFYILLILTLLAEIFMPFVVDIFAPGFKLDAEKFSLAVTLSRITFPFLIFVAITSFFGSILNTLGHFKPYASSPIILNLIMIFSLLFFASYFPNAAYTISWGVFFSGIIQILTLFFIARKYGFGIISFKFKISENVIKFSKRIVPGIMSAGIYHINIMIGSIFASETNGAISWIYYADRLNQLPLGVIGIALATVLLPSMSREIKKKNINKTSVIFNNSITFASLIVIPCAFGILSLSYPLIQIFFQRGEFKLIDTIATSNILQVLSLSLPALVFIKLFSNIFYAHGDTKTPMITGLISMLVNFILTFILSQNYGYIGIVISITTANWVNFLLLYYISYTKNFMKIYKSVLFDIFKITALSFIMAFIPYYMSFDFEIESLSLRILYLSILIIASVLFYVTSLFLFKVLTKTKLKKITKK